MSFAEDYEAYLAWTSEPKNPEEFDRIRQARTLVEDALADLLDERRVVSRVADAVARLKIARDLI